MRRTLPLMTLFALAALGCGVATSTKMTPTKAGRPTVAFVTNNSCEFWTIAQCGTDKAAKDFDVEVLFKRPAVGTAAEQKEIVDVLLNMKVQALAVSVNDPVNQKEYFDGIAARVPFITQDNDIPGGKQLCYVGTDNYQAGLAVGKLVKEALPNGGKVVIFVGNLESLNPQERRQGVLDELAGAKKASTAPGTVLGKYTFVNTYTDQADPLKAKENVVDALTKLTGEPDVAMVGLWGYNPPAIYQACKDKNLLGKVKIIGFDEDLVTLGGIAEGHIIGTVVQNPFEFGYQSVKMMTMLAKGDKSRLPADGKLAVPHRVITKTGGEGRMAVDVFKKELTELTKSKS